MTKVLNHKKNNSGQILDEISDMTRCMYDCVLSRTEDTMDIKNVCNLAKVLNM
jgi:hypothetical protein